MRRAQLLFAVSLAACGAAAPVTAPTGAGSDARPRSIGGAAKPETRASRAHWVPRVTQATYMRLSPMTNKVFGPVRNNYGSLASTYLGTERVGFVDHGRRFVYDHRKLTAIDGERALKKLERVEAIAGGLGGGFAFSGPNGVFFAETFEGPLRSLSTETGPFELAPFAIVMMPAGAVIATRTGAVVASAPKDIERVFTHRDGFTIVRSQTTAWLSTDSQKWRELRIGEVRDAAPDGEALLVATDRGSVRVKRDGSVAPAGLTDDEASARITMSHLAVDEYLAADQGFEGAQGDLRS